MQRTLAGFAVLGLLSCSGESPIAPESAREPIALARGGGSQTLYALTLAGGLQSDPAHPFSTMGVTGNPFSGAIGANPAYLVLPSGSGGDPSICNQDGSGQSATTGDWGGYAGVWKGNFTVAPKKGGSSYHVTYNATREDGTGWIWLVINSPGTKSTDNLTLTFTNVRGLVSLYSTPTGSFDPRVGPFDSQDRCLTFSITAAP